MFQLQVSSVCKEEVAAVGGSSVLTSPQGLLANLAALQPLSSDYLDPNVS